MNCYKLKLATVGILLSILAFPSCENCREKAASGELCYNLNAGSRAGTVPGPRR